MGDDTIAAMIGCVFTQIIVSDNEIEFIDDLNEKRFVMKHEQDCCEYVHIESIVGDMNDLLFHPILMAEEVCNRKGEEGFITPTGGFCDDSATWTFYKMATVKGYVDIRWFGTSNGYYSEQAAVYQVDYRKGAEK